jgi:ADP-ribosylglycohydrolase
MIANFNTDMLLFICMADAYALAAEYLKENEHNDHIENIKKYTNYQQHPKHLQAPGTFSDDGEMSCAIANVLLNYDYPFTKEQFADAFVAEFIRGGKRRGYSRGFQSVLDECETGGDLLEKVSGTSEKNGACMRAVPLGVIPDIHEMLNTAVLQASITHNTEPAIFSSKTVGLMSRFSLYTNDPFSKMGEFCIEFLEPEERDKYSYVFKTPWQGRVIGTDSVPVSITTVHAVHHLLTNYNSLMEIMNGVIDFGGDTDSVAAIAWGIASARYKYENIPGFMHQCLEPNNINTGESYLMSLGSRLFLKYG